MKFWDTDDYTGTDTERVAALLADAAGEPFIYRSPSHFGIVSDTSPLNYAGTRAAFVVQQRDDAWGAPNKIIANAMFQFTSTGDGAVTVGPNYSGTVWMGLTSTMTKTGDGSGHSFTSIGQLGAKGAVGYNELGLFQGTGTNIGSTNGYISGVEMLVRDSPDYGTTHYATTMQAVVGRVAKYDPAATRSYCFFASSEGTIAPAGVLGINKAGLKKWQTGIDFQGATFTTGMAMLTPNNNSLAWLTSSGKAAPVLLVSNSDDAYLAAPSPTSSVRLATSSFDTRLQIDSSSNDAVLLWAGGSLRRVGVGAPDSAGPGFRMLIVPN